ncbi:MAG: hypothetical protein AAGI68_06945 [Planctomycetota bacterium]
MTLRCNRGWDLTQNYQGTIYGEVQESHLWSYAAWMQESLMGDASVTEPLKRWAAHTFGPDAPLDELVAVFRPTGGVLEEALYIGHEPFGDLRSHVPIIRTTGGQDGGQGLPVKIARRYDDHTAELTGDHDGADSGIAWGTANPFHHGLSSHVYDPVFLPEYHMLRHGHPRCIKAKTASLAEARETLARCIARFDTLRDRVPAEPWAYYRFKLTVTQRELEFRGHAMLAYLFAAQRLYQDDAQRRVELEEPINHHLTAITRTAELARAETDAEQSHRGRTYSFSAWPPMMQAFADNLRDHFELPG